MLCLSSIKPWKLLIGITVVAGRSATTRKLLEQTVEYSTGKFDYGRNIDVPVSVGHGLPEGMFDAMTKAGDLIKIITAAMGAQNLKPGQEAGIPSVSADLSDAIREARLPILSQQGRELFT